LLDTSRNTVGLSSIQTMSTLQSRTQMLTSLFLELYSQRPALSATAQFLVHLIKFHRLKMVPILENLRVALAIRRTFHA